MRKTIRIGHDRYQGWRVFVDGCPNPGRRMAMMFRHNRRRGWDRRTSLAVAVDIVFGGDRARRYLVRRGWEPGREGSRV